MTRAALRGIARRRENADGWIVLSREEMADLITAAGYGHNAAWYRSHPQRKHECHPLWVRDFVLLASRGMGLSP